MWGGGGRGHYPDAFIPASSHPHQQALPAGLNTDPIPVVISSQPRTPRRAVCLPLTQGHRHAPSDYFFMPYHFLRRRRGGTEQNKTEQRKPAETSGLIVAVKSGDATEERRAHQFLMKTKCLHPNGIRRRADRLL